VSPAEWQPVIGLEVHCQLRTQTKLFCGCRNAFGEPPNTLVCPVCTGQPGALPVLGREALELAVRVALAVGADVAPWSRFDRKNYFYCDLPKGYQISQLDRPFCTGGGVELESGRRVEFERIHLEEDAGKAIHDRGTSSLVDLNRAGVPLIEAVTGPDVRSAEEAHEFLAGFRQILQYTGASDGDMEKGSLRCDVNVSVRHPGEELRTKVELKNLNSFAHVEAAIGYELKRQVAAYESGHAVAQETRQWDPGRAATKSLRGKEEAHDYRYFPEPDLVPVAVGAELLERQRAALPELPAARRARYVEQLGLSPYDAGVLTASRSLADFFEATARLAGSPKEAANWISNQVLRHLKGREVAAETVDELPFKPFDVAELIELVEKGRVSHNAGREILRAMFDRPVGALQLMRALELEQVEDSVELEAWCRGAIESRPDAAADVRAGKDKALGAMMGPVMQASKGRANPGAVRETLLRLIREG
jgi:aspartyl-tRNA(Asn)/glutamyl-tRNA(Gln) amidotransferase subunit B